MPRTERKISNTKIYHAKSKGIDRGIAYCGFDCNKCPYEDCVGCKKEGKKLPFCEDGCKIRKENISEECI